MEQDVDTGYRTVCSACLSSDRDLFDLNNSPQVYQICRLLMYDFAGDRFGESIPEIEQLVCWECLALMKRFHKFKWQVHSAQEHLRVLALSRSQESMDHTYMSQSLSCLEVETKTEYDKIYFDFSAAPEEQQYILSTHVQSVKSEHYDIAQAVSESNILDIDDQILEVPEIVLENPVTGVMSHIVVGTDALVSSEPITHRSNGELPHLTIGPLTSTKIETVIMCQKSKPKPEKPENKMGGWIAEYMSETDMLTCREEAKQKVQYASSVYKCELCIIGFYTQQQVEDHFVSAHRAKPGQVPCKVCYVFIDESKLTSHTNSHYMRYSCKLCGHVEFSCKLMQHHVRAHMSKQTPNAQIKIGDVGSNKSRKKKEKKLKDAPATPPKPGDLRKLLSKTTIEGYQCLECDMFFKNSRARKNHVARYHREGLQCDHCKKRFVNRTTLATHLST